MEPEPEDEEQAAAAAATEAPDESTVVAARVSIAGHEVAADSTTLDISGWVLTAAQVREFKECRKADEAAALREAQEAGAIALEGQPAGAPCAAASGDAELGRAQQRNDRRRCRRKRQQRGSAGSGSARSSARSAPNDV